MSPDRSPDRSPDQSPSQSPGPGRPDGAETPVAGRPPDWLWAIGWPKPDGRSDGPGSTRGGRRGAVVEIVDPGVGPSGVLLPSCVLVDGHDVGLIATGGVQVDVGDRMTPTVVHLTLLPRRVIVRGEGGR